MHHKTHGDSNTVDWRLNCSDEHLLFHFSGGRGDIHRQEVSVYRKCEHPRQDPDGGCEEYEDEENGCDPQGLPPLHQEVQPL